LAVIVYLTPSLRLNLGHPSIRTILAVRIIKCDTGSSNLFENAPDFRDVRRKPEWSVIFLFCKISFLSKPDKLSLKVFWP